MQPSDIQKRIEALPKNVRDAIEGFNWGEHATEIGQKYGLHFDAIEQFRQQTLLVILGQLSADRYEQALVQSIGVSRETASELVQEANEHIFSELQRRAFREEDEEDHEERTTYEREPVGYMNEMDDPYAIEPLDPEDIRGVFQAEGIELLDENTIIPTTGRMTETETVVRPDNEPEEQEIEQDEVVSSEITSDIQQGPNPTPYQEPIEEEDLRGVPGHRIDTDVLPKTEESSGPRAQSFQERFDQHLMENPFIAKGDHHDLSPTKEEQLPEPEGFLKQLHNDENGLEQ